jgi:hypothetical protein
MFDGMYLIRFIGAADEGAGVLVLDRGGAYGVDVAGVRYDGRYEPGPAPDTLTLRLRVTVLPGVHLVQSEPPRGVEYWFPVSCTFSAAGECTIAVETPFDPVVVNFKRLRDLPRVAA